MKYAVIETGGKQYKVAPGQILRIEKLNDTSGKPVEKGKKIEFDKVLLLVDEDNAKIGQPYLDTKIKAKVLGQERAEKIVISKYKAKTGYSRKVGHRQSLTKVQIEK